MEVHILKIFLLLISLIYSSALLPSITQTIAVETGQSQTRCSGRLQRAEDSGKVDFSRQKIAWAPIFRLFLRAKS